MSVGFTVLAMLLASAATGSPTPASAEVRSAPVRELFDQLPTGALGHGVNGWTVDATIGNSVAVVDVPSATNKSVSLTRANGLQGSAGTTLSRVFPTSLAGVITISAKVMRSDGEQGGWFGLPYLYNEAGAPAVSVAFARGEIQAYDGTTLKAVKPYVQGQWHEVTLRVDTTRQRFDLEIDGETVLGSAAFRTNVLAFSRISWYANNAERGTAHVDKVKIFHRNAKLQDHGTTYYISADGDDNASGTSPQQAWRSLEKVNATIFQPGDSILLRGGDTWTGQLWPKGSGAPGQPIVVDRFGSGRKPRIAGNGTVGEAVRLFNQEYWTIRRLDVSNMVRAGDAAGAHLRDLRGIGVHGDNGQTLDNFLIDAVDVHDVTGEINWIGGDPKENSPGVNWGTGWDRSKNTGGIIFVTSVRNPASPGNPTVLNHITVQNSTIRNTSFANVTVKQYTGSTPGAVQTGWGERRTANDPRFTPHTNVVIRDNYLSQADTPYGGNGVYLTNVRGGLVEHNVLEEVGVSGIETFAADQVTVQFNEISGTRHTQGSADANGIDPDIGTTNQLIQYNYLHDNGDGILLCGCRHGINFGSAVVRYNVVTGSKRWNLHLAQSPGTVAQIYHNTFVSSGAPHMVSGYMNGRAEIRNNVFASTTAVSFMQSPNVTWAKNGYSGGITAPPADTTAVVADARFVDPDVSGPYGDARTGPLLETARGFSLAPESTFINAGGEVAGRGERDFSGRPALIGAAADLGAFEYQAAG